MRLRSIFYDPASIRTALIIVGLVLGMVAYLLRCKRYFKQNQNESEGTQGESVVLGSVAEYWIQAFPKTLPYGVRILRSGLILLALVVAGGFTLILLPEGTIQKMVQTLQASRVADLPPEKIALLYLGDETKTKEFRIRGVVRNISAQPVEKLDAIVRLYSPEGNLLETVVVRMDLDSISPDGTSEFHLVYPNYSGQFGSYSVDFKFRHGDLVPHKDRRGARHFN